MGLFSRLFGKANKETSTSPSRDAKILAEMKKLDAEAMVMLAHKERVLKCGKLSTSEYIIQKIMYTQERVQSKYGLSDEEFTRLYELYAKSYGK